MKKEICYCDRCGEEIKTKTRFKYFNAKGELAKAIIEDTDVNGYVADKYLEPLEFDSVKVILAYIENEKKYDLCKKCLKKLNEFMENKEDKK